MFRATMYPSSGTDDCVVLSLRVGIVPWLQEGCQNRLAGSVSIEYFVATYYYLLTSSDSLPAATAQCQHVAITQRSGQLLKMGTWLPETCWATCKGEIKDNTKWHLVGFLSILIELFFGVIPEVTNYRNKCGENNAENEADKWFLCALTCRKMQHILDIRVSRRRLWILPSFVMPCSLVEA